jgi:hypothetical protein
VSRLRASGLGVCSAHTLSTIFLFQIFDFTMLPHFSASNCRRCLCTDPLFVTTRLGVRVCLCCKFQLWISSLKASDASPRL